MSKPTKSQKPHFQSIDAYIAIFPEQVQARLQAIRAVITTSAPHVEERISYNMPAFTINGRSLYLAAWKKHIAIYPAPAGLTATIPDGTQYLGAKSTLKFPNNTPLPLELIHTIIQLSAAEHLANTANNDT